MVRAGRKIRRGEDHVGSAKFHEDLLRNGLAERLFPGVLWAQGAGREEDHQGNGSRCRGRCRCADRDDYKE